MTLSPNSIGSVAAAQELDRQLANLVAWNWLEPQYPPVPGKDRTGRAFGSRTCEQLAAPPSKAIPFVRRRTSSACWLAVIIPTIDHLLSRRRHFPCGPVPGKQPSPGPKSDGDQGVLIGYGTTRRAGALPHEPTPTRCRVFGASPPTPRRRHRRSPQSWPAPCPTRTRVQNFDKSLAVVFRRPRRKPQQDLFRGSAHLAQITRTRSGRNSRPSASLNPFVGVCPERRWRDVTDAGTEVEDPSACAQQ